MDGALYCLEKAELLAHGSRVGSRLSSLAPSRFGRRSGGAVELFVVDSQFPVLFPVSSAVSKHEWFDRLIIIIISSSESSSPAFVALRKQKRARERARERSERKGKRREEKDSRRLRAGNKQRKRKEADPVTHRHTSLGQFYFLCLQRRPAPASDSRPPRAPGCMPPSTRTSSRIAATRGAPIK